MSHWEILIFFFFVATVYASVGFGGGSSYLAILALYNLPFREIRLIALLCNIIVVTGGVLLYISRNQVKWRKVLPLVIMSVPFAFMGALIKLNENSFFLLLGISLLIASVLLWIRVAPESKGFNHIGNENPSNDLQGGPLYSIPVITKRTPKFEAIIGGAVGFLSGMIGIGGGIFLSPLLNLLKWDTSRVIAATASVFILVNSLAGIAGQSSQLNSLTDWKMVGSCGLVVLLGGQAGSRMGIRYFTLATIQRITSVLVFLAGVEILVKHLKF